MLRLDTHEANANLFADMLEPVRDWRIKHGLRGSCLLPPLPGAIQTALLVKEVFVNLAEADTQLACILIKLQRFEVAFVGPTRLRDADVWRSPQLIAILVAVVEQPAALLLPLR